MKLPICWSSIHDVHISRHLIPLFRSWYPDVCGGEIRGKKDGTRIWEIYHWGPASIVLVTVVTVARTEGVLRNEGWEWINIQVSLEKMGVAWCCERIAFSIVTCIDMYWLYSDYTGIPYMISFNIISHPCFLLYHLAIWPDWEFHQRETWRKTITIWLFNIAMENGP